jgi:RNA polymerase sigma-70 factor (ECF subfamily)
MIPKPLAPAEDLRATPEDALVARARKQDEAAVRELIRRLNPRLFRVARGILGSDAAQEWPTGSSTA